MKEFDHKKMAEAVAKALVDCGFPAFACVTSTAYNYQWADDPVNATFTVHIVAGPDDDVRNLETLREDIEEDEFADFSAREEVFTGVCGHPEAVESLEHQLKREPWLKSYLQLEEEEDEEEESNG